MPQVPALYVIERLRELIRAGIAIYGCDPMNEDPARPGLEPALELSSYLAAVKPARAGDSVGYGRRFSAERDTWIGTIPIGYADGIRRELTNNCDVLVNGTRYPLVGTVSMANITIDLGPNAAASVGAAAIHREVAAGFRADMCAPRLSLTGGRFCAGDR